MPAQRLYGTPRTTPISPRLPVESPVVLRVSGIRTRRESQITAPAIRLDSSESPSHRDRHRDSARGENTFWNYRQPWEFANHHGTRMANSQIDRCRARCGKVISVRAPNGRCWARPLSNKFHNLVYRGFAYGCRDAFCPFASGSGGFIETTL